MQLSLRLSALADMVTEGNRLADVGCDHGYLPVYLVQTGKIPGAIAMDVGEGPLSRARKHIEQYGLSRYIECRLSDGLKQLSPGEAETLVIAGMGGPLMERILSECPQTRDSFQELILQPQSDIPHFRRFLCGIGYVVTKEELVEEDGKFYPMMKAVRGPHADAPERMPGEAGGAALTDEEAAFGKLLLEQRHPVLLRYLRREARIRDEISQNLRNASGEKAEKRRTEIEEERRLIAAALKRYEGI